MLCAFSLRPCGWRLAASLSRDKSSCQSLENAVQELIDNHRNLVGECGYPRDNPNSKLIPIPPRNADKAFPFEAIFEAGQFIIAYPIEKLTVLMETAAAPSPVLKIRKPQAGQCMPLENLSA